MPESLVSTRRFDKKQSKKQTQRKADGSSSTIEGLARIDPTKTVVDSTFSKTSRSQRTNLNKASTFTSRHPECELIMKAVTDISGAKVSS